MAGTPYGFLFQSLTIEADDANVFHKFYFVSLNNASFSNSTTLSWREDENNIQAVVPATAHHPIPLDFNYLLAHIISRKSICATHRGLILLRLRTTSTYHVYNPFNAQTFPLPNSPSLPLDPELRNAYYRELEDAAIVNFSTAERRFKVIRIYRQNGRRAEVYSSNNNQWNVYTLDHIPEEILNLTWYLRGALFVNGTLYFIAGANLRFVVGVNVPLSNGPITVVRCLHLPQPIPNGLTAPTLHVSQGYLYISYASQGYLGIWRLEGDPQAWISQFIFENNGANPHRPRAVEYLRGMSPTVAEPLGMHPERPIVYLYRESSIVAFDLSNDLLAFNNEVERIQLQDDPSIFPRDFYLFSPCPVLLAP